MIGIDCFLTLLLHLSHIVRVRILQKNRDVLLDRWIVLFECQDIISILLGNRMGHLFLTTHRAPRSDA